MTITVRLPDQLEAKLRRRLVRERVGLSEFVRAAIAEKLAGEPEECPSPYELGKHLFGRYGSGDPEMSGERKRRVREAVGAKHRRR